MRPSELVGIVEAACAELNLAYFVTGSVASSYYGEFRTTHDVDVVVALGPGDARAFCARFSEPDWYVSEPAAREAVTRAGMFNIIHVGSGLKIDVAIPGRREADRLRLRRRRRVVLDDGSAAWFSAPEDVILSKLEFFREGGSEKHIRDIASMLRAPEGLIDLAYVDTWAPRLGVEVEWHAVKRRLNLA